MKKTTTESKPQLPKFEFVTLDREKLDKVTGGMKPIGCTCGTQSVCHEDGTDDEN